jgi:hypothetical protein
MPHYIFEGITTTYLRTGGVGLGKAVGLFGRIDMVLENLKALVLQLFVFAAPICFLYEIVQHHLRDQRILLMTYQING